MSVFERRNVTENAESIVSEPNVQNRSRHAQNWTRNRQPQTDIVLDLENLRENIFALRESTAELNTRKNISKKHSQKIIL